MGLAVGAGHAVYVADSGAGDIALYKPENVEVPTISIKAPSAVTGTTAELSGTVDPNGAKPASNTSWHFQCTPACPGLKGGEVKADTAAHEISVEATGLAPHTQYEVTLVASNAADNEKPAEAGPESFTTLAIAPTIEATYAASVGETEATLKAQINPGGAATSFHFEYLSKAQLEENEKEGHDPFAGASSTETAFAGENDEVHLVSAPLSALQPDSAYVYRVLIENSVKALSGPARTLHTSAAAPSEPETCPNAQLRAEDNSTHLPDCRAYELVSPAEKLGFSAVGEGFGLLPVQASADGESLAYLSQAPLPGAADNERPKRLPCLARARRLAGQLA